MTERKSPVDQALDLLVFAPLGLALTAAEELPKLIDKGREKATAQTGLYRLMGQFAVSEGQKRAERLVRQAQERLSDLTGTADSGASTPPPSSSPAPPPPAPKPAASNGSGNGQRPGPRPSSDALAIPGYDTLSASQVVQRLAGLSAEELEAVRAYEATTRGRKTILSRVAQLQSGG